MYVHSPTKANIVVPTLTSGSDAGFMNFNFKFLSQFKGLLQNKNQPTIFSLNKFIKKNNYKIKNYEIFINPIVAAHAARTHTDAHAIPMSMR